VVDGRAEWAGDQLGGKGKGVTREGLDALAKDKRRLLLLCQEQAPADCHRFHSIALPPLKRGINVLHVFEDEVIETTDLKRAIKNDTEYMCYALAEVIEELQDGKAC
jgi:hypothetical protein